MSTDENKSLLTLLGKDENKDTIPNRIQFVKTLLNNNNLRPIINFDNTDTENFINKSRDDEDSGESYDTRVALRKKVHDITDVINNMGGTLKYIKSGTTGHTFKGEEIDENTGEVMYEYAVKVVAYTIKDKYGGMHDTRRPENAELLMIKLLSYFIVKKRTPHIVLPIGTFDTDITHFTNLIEQGYVDSSNERYKEFIERYNNGEYYDEVSILISEWANRGDFLDFVKKKYRNFTPIHWKVFFFQLISTLAVIQSKFPSFRHNDLKANNILVTKINKNVDTFKYKVMGNSYRIPNIGYQLKIWDFDFACIPGIVDNKKVMISNRWSRGINVGPTQNRYYDVHYFFNTLIKRGFFPELLTDYRIPDEVKEFVISIVPPEYQSGDSVSQKGRILHNMEYTTPRDILKTSPYFEEFRVKSRERTNYRANSKTKRPSGPKIDNFLRGGSDMKIRSKSSSVTREKKTTMSITSLNNTSSLHKKGVIKKRNNTKSKSKSKSKRRRDSIENNEKETISKYSKRSKKKDMSKKNKNRSISSGSKKRNTQKRLTKKRSIGDIDIDKLLMGLS